MSKFILIQSIFIFYEFLICGARTATLIEDKMETEIDLRSPNSFHQNYSSKILSIRPYGVEKLFYNRSGVISSTSAHWSFTQKYWYETRDKDSLCPITPIGFSTLVDWALLSPCLFTDKPTENPRSVFVHTPMLPHFVESTLNGIDQSARFVLITAGCDTSVPQSFFQFGAPLRGFSKDMGSYWGKLLNDRRIIHWFAENHDLNHEKISTLPTAFVANPRKHTDDFSDHPDRKSIVPLEKRPLKFIVSDKVREGTGHYADRQYAIDQCEKKPEVCYFPKENYTRENGLPHKNFVEIMTKYPFISCVHGWGIEPSPKAWEAVLLGCIPIIQHSTLDDAYEQLPVVFIDQWKDLFEHPNIEEVIEWFCCSVEIISGCQMPNCFTYLVMCADLLKDWLSKLSKYYEEGSELRQKVLGRLNTDYWWGKVQSKIRQYDAQNQSSGTISNNRRSLFDASAAADNEEWEQKELWKNKVMAFNGLRSGV